ncbi:unnamed protein product [Moneuplotes crassus]|uniref:Uncharacterized protein n=1 Tax=Euplotes crassus TaxID=5936 RepID=A0AAD1U4D6_EUPCR|nr:unnamed protein product [Moneuplotes crassus]
MKVKVIKKRRIKGRTKYEKVTEKKQNLQRVKEYRMKSITMFKQWRFLEPTLERTRELKVSIQKNLGDNLPSKLDNNFPSDLKETFVALPVYKNVLLKLIEYLTPVEIVYKYARVCRAFYLQTHCYEFLYNYLMSTIGKKKYLEMKYFITINIYPDIDTMSGDESLAADGSGPVENHSKREYLNSYFVEGYADNTKLSERIEEDNKSTSEEERDLDNEISRIQNRSIHKETDPILTKIRESTDFLHRFLIFLAELKVCVNCGVMEENIESKSLLIICPILGKPLCFNCKKSDSYKMVNIKGALRKYALKKEEFDRMKLRYISAPNSYYSNKPMRLYYEFQVEEKMKEINEKRDLIQQEKSRKKEYEKLVKKFNIHSEKLTENLLCLQDHYYDKGEFEVFDKYIVNAYLNTPYLHRYLDKKLYKVSPDELMLKLYENHPLEENFVRKTSLPEGKFFLQYLEGKGMYELREKRFKKKNFSEDKENSSMDENDIDEQKTIKLAEKVPKRVTRKTTQPEQPSPQKTVPEPETSPKNPKNNCKSKKPPKPKHNSKPPKPPKDPKPLKPRKNLKNPKKSKINTLFSKIENQAKKSSKKRKCKQRLKKGCYADLDSFEQPPKSAKKRSEEAQIEVFEKLFESINH